MRPLLVALTVAISSGAAGEEPSAKRGYELLRSRPYVTTDFDQEVFEKLWTVWPERLRSKAEKASKAERRKMAFSRYGLIEPPEKPGEGPALGYVSRRKNGWVLNCFACHGGKVAGKTIPGAPNSHIDLQTLAEEVKQVKTKLGKPYTHFDTAIRGMPLSHTAGTTNAVMFGVLLEAARKPDMSLNLLPAIPKLTHHDVDAPAWWTTARKKRIYADGAGPKNHRLLMQFILIPSNRRAQVLKYEPDFKHILAYINSLKPPKYPFAINKPLASRGEKLFRKHCASCHGTYGEGSKYPNRVIAWDKVRTDRVRLDAIRPAARKRVNDSWLAFYGKQPTTVSPKGYLAPPLDGVWASAPYFHNGSVPTLWHVLHPQQRPQVWRRTEDGYDKQKVGLEVSNLKAVPGRIKDVGERRKYFDSSIKGKSPAGHEFPNVLNNDEKRAVLEYLKTL